MPEADVSVLATVFEVHRNDLPALHRATAWTPRFGGMLLTVWLAKEEFKIVDRALSLREAAERVMQVRMELAATVRGATK